jgi:hypothetical protein
MGLFCNKLSVEAPLAARRPGWVGRAVPAGGPVTLDGIGQIGGRDNSGEAGKNITFDRK